MNLTGKNKARLAFEMLEKEFEVLSEEEMRGLKGGDGIITGGSGTLADPYKITTSVVYNGNNSDILNALNYTSGVVEINQKYYTLEISISSNSLPKIIGGTDNVGNSFSYQQTYIREVSSGFYGSNPNAYGTASPYNSVTLWGGKIDSIKYDGALESTGYTLWTKSDVIRATTFHEIGHTLGLNDNAEGISNMNQMQVLIEENNQYIVGGPGAFDAAAIQAMLDSGRIHDMTGSTGIISYQNIPNTIGSTGLISEYQENDGSWWQNFYYYDNDNPQYTFENGGNNINDPSGVYEGYSTGYVNLTTNTYYVNDDFLPFIPDSTGEESTGN